MCRFRNDVTINTAGFPRRFPVAIRGILVRRSAPGRTRVRGFNPSPVRLKTLRIKAAASSAIRQGNQKTTPIFQFCLKNTKEYTFSGRGSFRLFAGLNHELLLLESRLVQSETNGRAQIFFNFALREENHIGAFRQTSETRRGLSQAMTFLHVPVAIGRRCRFRAYY